jgi:hypothetical protein
MSLQKYLETVESVPSFELKASAPMAGPYDLNVCWDYWNKANPVGCSPLAVHLILAYQHIYGFEDTLEEIFQPPYNTVVLSADDGTHNGDQMYVMLPKTMQELLQPEFIAAVNAHTHPLWQELSDNKTYNFVPVTPTRLYHGIDDELCPYTLSVSTYQYFIEHGATDVELVNVGSGYSHVGSLFPSLLSAKEWFDSF